MFDNFNVNLCKNKGFLTYIPYIPIPEYGQSNAPLISLWFYHFASSNNDNNNQDLVGCQHTL